MAKKHLIRAAGYARRSTDLQDRSIPDQKAYVERWAKDHGYRIVRWYVDDAISGTSTRGRDDFGAMLKAAENGRDFDCILCYDISRFSRGGTNETGYYLHRFKLASVDVLFPAEAIPEGDEGELIQGVKSWQARQYSVKLSRDTIRGTISYVRERHGAPGGVPPYGYDKQHVTADGQVVRTLRWLPDGSKQEFDTQGNLVRLLGSNETIKKARSDIIRYVPSTPERVAVVQRVFQRYLDGRGYASIAHELNQEGIPTLTGTHWSPQMVKRLVTNPVYRGAVAWNRRTCGKINGVGGDGTLRAKKGFVAKDNPEEDWIIGENAHEPLVSADVFARAQQSRKRRRYLGGLAKTTNRSLLSGLIVCTNCGHNFYQKFHNYVRESTGEHIRYYVDGGYNRKGRAACRPVNVPADALDAWVVGKVRAVILGDHEAVDEAVDAFVKQVLLSHKPGIDGATIEKELAAVSKRIKATVALLADPDLGDLDELRGALVDLKAKRAALEARRRDVSRSDGRGYQEGELRAWAATRLELLAEGFNPRQVSPEFRRLIHAFVDHIDIHPFEKRGVVYLPADAVACLERETSSRVALGDHRGAAQ